MCGGKLVEYFIEKNSSDFSLVQVAKNLKSHGNFFGLVKCKRARSLPWAPFFVILLKFLYSLLKQLFSN